ncbi:envelope stress sensor histidine kinase CpxA [Glaesserella parasuis]|uniref:envelope stress sensor histidine kinase CpxA n=1 Tax=Glaesserella parasuis TaxID=738 RepID=UPI00042922DE|nr:envelope stress sensor histidine kinase CpxA [Glaesserella parasuis]KDD81239.1 histidine kinase [Glaesserella parasuis ST4-1]MCT8776338.1 envelope stress sensor histidine kinase CpxA [Glaesserella parasuis]MDD2157370.1 envelope stress sensor histidine kinase CpxA [Glaesserella parasuis]MDE3954600.1 envelope stress sensor histidine kinase CpxA [Glaesserella parasuis]MDE4006529.1 envelope stress sensor histidine kinase CpxA [Glaesserella parasuis]
MLKLRNFRRYLAYQIFASFMVIIAIILALAILLPSLDTRRFKQIDDFQLGFLQHETKYVEQEYNLDEVFRHNLSVASINGFDIILFDHASQQLAGIREENNEAFHAFIYKAKNHLQPLQRRFGTMEFYGPFLASSHTRTYDLYFTKKVNPQRELINTLFDSPWIMLLLLLFVSSPVMIWLSYRIAKPVKELRLTANAVARGNLAINPKLETSGIEELRQVGASFNEMIVALERLTNYQHRLLSDISHELKTPLTRMQLALSLLLRRNGESSEITRIEGEITKLDTMIHDLLVLSRKQANHHLERKVFPIHKIWDDVLNDAKFELEQSGFDLVVSQRILHPERYFVNGNVVLLASAVENVIRNAKKYAQTTVKVMFYIDASDLYILVDDDGEGVPEDQYKEIFRPFYRVQEDRARQTGGTGLGLSIVANAIRQHHGSVRAEKSPLGGLRVKMQLPLWVE